VSFFNDVSLVSLDYSQNSNRAVAEGSVSFYIQNHVHLRIARFTYGVMCTREFERHHPEHRKRSSSVLVNPSGTAVLPGGYQTVLRKASISLTALGDILKKPLRVPRWLRIANFLGHSFKNRHSRRKRTLCHAISLVTEEML
jgi:hypothetical protein